MNELMHPAVILLLDNDSADCDYIREWFAESRFQTSNAQDVFEAIEAISDFTIRDRPDVVLLPVDSPIADYDLVRELVQTAPGEPDHPIIALSKKKGPAGCADFFGGDFTEVTARLESIIPRSMGVSA